MSDKKHILVVEDEQHLALGIKFNLEAEGYRVSIFGEGPPAIHQIEHNPDDIDLVVLDLMLPGMSGYEICRSLRNAGHDMPVLMLSARTLSEDRTRGFEVGADQYMMKPFDLPEFLSRVKNLLLYRRRSEATAKPAASIERFEFAGAVIDFPAFEVRVRNESVKVRMTPMELKLLRYFIENEGRVISRRELLEKIWDMPRHIATRAPDQFVRRLRKIFEPDPAEPRHFLTIRDAGYRFLSAGEG